MVNQAALNLATLNPADPLERKLYAASRAGFAAVGLRQEDMEQSWERTRQELLMSDLALAELEGVAGWMQPGRTTRSLALVQAEEVFATAAELGAALVVAWPSDDPVDTLTAATYFADLCRAAEALGVRVGLECLGHLATVKDIASAWRIVEIAEMPNGGLVIDAFHFHRGGSTVEMIEQIPGEMIFLVQVCDVPDLTPSELTDQQRLYPGMGWLELEPLLAAIRAKGYAGYYSLELHNEEYWKEDPIAVAAEGLRAMRRLDLV